MVVCPTCNRPTRVGMTDARRSRAATVKRARLQARRLRRGDRQVMAQRPRRLRAAPEGSSTTRSSARSCKDELGLSSIMQVPRAPEDHAEHGRRRGEDRREGARQRDRGADDDRRPARADAPARKSIASFKIREGMPIGARVTLRGARMYEFLDRLVSIALPAHPRLPRPRPALVRRPRQLLARHPRADHLPRDRLRRRRRASAASTSRSRRSAQNDEQGARAPARRSACRSQRETEGEQQ